MTNKLQDVDERRNRQVVNTRRGLEYAIGAVFIIIGVFSFFRFKGDNTMILFGVVAILYGIWRLFKAFKKKGY